MAERRRKIGAFGYDSKHCMRAFREGCECYVTKPVSRSDLLRKVRELGLLDAQPPQPA